MPLSIPEFRDEWGNCQRCDLGAERKRLVFGDGNPRADILVVGESPGPTEDETGLPFQGDAGNIVEQFLENVGLDRDNDLYLTNTVCCRPTVEVEDERTGKLRLENRPPSKIEREACKPRLLETIYRVDPLLVITIGKVPFQVLMGQAPKMAAIRGQMQTLHIMGRHMDLRYGLMPLFHTAFLHRTHDKREEGPWGRTLLDWAVVCNVIDHLREAYYGTPRPDREAMINAKREQTKRR